MQHAGQMIELCFVQHAFGAMTPMVVNHPRVRQIIDLPAPFFHAIAPVHVLEIEEKAFVHQADFFQRVAPDHQARAEHPIDFPRGIMIPVGHQMAGEQRAVREEFAEKRAAQQEHRQRVKRAARILKRAVGIQQLAADNPRVRRSGHEREHRFDRARRDFDVRIQDKDVVGIKFPDRLIHGFGVAAVHGVANQRD